MPSPQPKKASGPQPADDGLDKIPMQKTSPVWIVASVVVVLVVGGLVAFNLSSGNKNPNAIPQPYASVSADPEPPNAQVDQKAQREHQATTERALAALEAKKKEQATLEPGAAPVASDKPETEKPKPAAKKSGGAPPPAAAKLNELGASIESQLK